MGVVSTAGQTVFEIAPVDGGRHRLVPFRFGWARRTIPGVSGSVRHYSRRLSIRSMFHASVPPVAQKGATVDT